MGQIHPYVIVNLTREQYFENGTVIVHLFQRRTVYHRVDLEIFNRKKLVHAPAINVQMNVRKKHKVTWNELSPQSV